MKKMKLQPIVPKKYKIIVPKKYKNNIELKIAYYEGKIDEMKRNDTFLEKELLKRRSKYI